MAPFPKFLVIGAQKCGTTTIYEDLQSHPEIYIPDKEASGLVGLNPNETASVESYAALFRPGANSLVGEVSTLYSMFPKYDVVRTASDILDSPQIIYIVREPISRVISHHNHAYSLGLMGPDIDAEVWKHSELIENSCYATQIGPWIKEFGRSNVHIIRFEDYMAERQTGANAIFRELGLTPWALPTVSQAFNTADNKFVSTGGWAKLSSSAPYRRLIRPLISEQLRRKMMRLVLPKPAKRPSPPSKRTVLELARHLQPEVAALSKLTETEPWWNLDAVVESYHR